MKKLMLSMALTSLMLTHALAQPVETEKKKEQEIQIEIQENRVVIEAGDLADLSTLDLNKILREVGSRTQAIVQQQQELLAQVDRQLAQGEITEEQAEEMRDLISERTEESLEAVGELMEVWGEQYEARMEAWEEKYEAEMEAWEEEVEARAEKGDFVMPPFPPVPPVPAPESPAGDTKRKVIIDDDGITIVEGEDGEKPFALKFEEEMEEHEDDDHDYDHDDHDDDDHDFDRTETYVDFHFGYNQVLRNGEEFITSGQEELKFGKSVAWELGLGGKTRIGSPMSKLYLKWGGEFSWHNFRLMGDNILFKTPNEVMIIEDTLRNITESKYHIAYFNVPLMLQLDFSEVGDRDESFTLGAGGYAGIRLGAKRELEYDSEEFQDAEEKLEEDFFTNQFRYGVMGQLGWGNFKLTGKYDLNPFFQESKGPDYQMAQIMIGLTF